jgi:hypothetical protein
VEHHSYRRNPTLTGGNPFIQEQVEAHTYRRKPSYKRNPLLKEEPPFYRRNLTLVGGTGAMTGATLLLQ